MKAAVWYGGKDIRIEDVPKPEVRSSEVLIRVRSVGICGSELHAYEGASRRRKPPLIMGHEFSGEAAEIGADVKHLGVGERIVVDPIIRCGACEQCLRGQGNVCRNLRLVGLHTCGAFAEYVSVEATNCHALPDSLTFDEGSMVEPLGVAVHAVNRTPVKLGDTVVVVGAGIIGLMALQAAKAAGAGSVIVTDVLDYRLDFARSLGADFTVNSRFENLPERTMELTDGRGADVALEAVGLEATVRDAMSVLGRGGRLTILGMLAQKMTLDILDAVVNELEIKGSYCYTSEDFKRALNFIKNQKIDVKPLITNVFPLDEAAKGFGLMHQKTERVLKVVLKP